MAWQSARSTSRTAALIAGINGTLTDSSSTPRPSNNGTARVSDAMAPHTPTHLPWVWAALTVLAIRRSTDGWKLSA
ncbi:hypothetical protein D3C86_1932300 [compost metagenome]